MQKNEGNSLSAVGEKILRVSRNVLYLKMRFLDVALGSLMFVRIREQRALEVTDFFYTTDQTICAGCTGKIQCWSTVCICTRFCTGSSGI